VWEERDPGFWAERWRGEALRRGHFASIWGGKRGKEGWGDWEEISGAWGGDGGEGCGESDYLVSRFDSSYSKVKDMCSVVAWCLFFSSSVLRLSFLKMYQRPCRSRHHRQAHGCWAFQADYLASNGQPKILAVSMGVVWTSWARLFNCSTSQFAYTRTHLPRRNAPSGLVPHTKKCADSCTTRRSVSVFQPRRGSAFLARLQLKWFLVLRSSASLAA